MLVFFVAAGDLPPHTNEAHYLCRLKHYWDPSYCAGDLFLESPEAHLTIVLLLGWLTWFVSLPVLAWIGRILSWTLIAWGWTRLSRRVAPYPGVSVLGAALLVVGTQQTHFAGEWIIGGFEAKTLAYGVLLHALRAWLDRKWTLAWALIGLTTAMHALVGGWSAVALLFARSTGAAVRPRLRAMAPGLAIAAAVGSLGVVPPLVMNAGVDPQIASEANQIYVFERIAHHLAPLSKPLPWIQERIVSHTRMLLLLLALCLTVLGRSKRVVARLTSLRLLARFAWGAALVSATGLLIETALWNHPALAASVLKYYWFRLSDIAAPLAGSLIICAALGRGLTAARDGIRTATVLAGVALLALCAWGVGGHAVNRFEKPIAPADRKHLEPNDWAVACDWIRENLPEDAVLITPRQGSSFKWRAERPEVVTYKDIPQDAASMVEWRRRLHDVFQVGTWQDGSPRWASSVAGIGATRLIELGERYGATHALSETPRYAAPGSHRASLPVVGRWGIYTLYVLPRPADR